MFLKNSSTAGGLRPPDPPRHARLRLDPVVPKNSPHGGFFWYASVLYVSSILSLNIEYLIVWSISN